MDITIILLVFSTCVLMTLAVLYYMEASGTGRAWRERIEGKDGSREHRYPDLKHYAGKVLSSLGRVNAPGDEAEASEIKKELQAAGYRSANAPFLFSGTQIFFMAFFPTALFLAHPDWMRTMPPSALIACYVVLAGVGYYGPKVWLSNQIARRQSKIAEAFPDALDLMVICVEAGLSLNSAIGRIGDELKLAHKELSEEFHFLSLELRTGLSRQQALRNLSRRIGLDEVKNLVSVLIQTERFGTSVAQALSVLSESMRRTRQHKAEEKAAQLPVKLIFPLVFFIFPSLFVVILGPAFVRMSQTLLPVLSKMGGNQ